jgi:hypothetical protein
MDDETVFGITPEQMNRLIMLGRGEAPSERAKPDSDAAQAEGKDASMEGLDLTDRSACFPSAEVAQAEAFG